jgi:hypothetical protein
VQNTTISEVDQYIDNFVHDVVQRIHTRAELEQFLTACDVKVSETTDERLRELLVEIEERVFLGKRFES